MPQERTELSIADSLRSFGAGGRSSALRIYKRQAGQRVALLVLAASLFSLSALPARAAAPNVILVSIDTLRADHLGCYGYARRTSPALDALAREGTVFSDTSAPSPWTRPSHASLFTGLYPSRHGVRTPAHALSPRVATLAEWFAAEGYATRAIVNSEHLDERFGLTRGFAELDYVSEWSRWPPWSRHIVDRGDTVTDRALRALSTTEDRPFFLFLHYYDVHSDYDPRSAYRRLFVGPYAGPLDGGTTQLLEIQESHRPLARADRDHLVDLYDAEIRQLDAELARLFAFLDEKDLADSTVIAVTSDHGEEFLEHGSVLHGQSLYQETVAVPLIVRGPEISAGRRVAWLSSLVDVPPTLLSVAGLPVPTGLDGVDLSLRWSTPSGEPEPRTVFAEADHRNAELDVKRMARRGRWKLLHDRSAQTWELYDLSTDPGETVDLAKSVPKIAAELSTELGSFMSREQGVAESIEIPPEDRERLRSLGYD